MGISIVQNVVRPGDPGTTDSFRNGGVTIREPFPRIDASSSSLAALTSGVMTFVAVPLFAGDVIGRIAFRSGGTAGVSLTNHWFALYGPEATPALIAQTADQGSAAWGSNTTKELALPSAFTVTQSGLYYAACMVAASTVPNTCGRSGPSQVWQANSFVSGQRVFAGTVGSSLTGTAPATLSGFTTSGNAMYCTLRA